MKRSTTWPSSVDAIGGFAGVITEIALKTKLLALNTEVEAARSGEHGLGFAIIAREVKDLSDQTSKATESINDVIGRVKGTTALALSAVNDIVRSIEAVEKTSGEMAKAVDQQVAATRSIAANVTETERSTAGVTAKFKKSQLMRPPPVIRLPTWIPPVRTFPPK